MKNAKYMIFAATLILAISVTTSAKSGIIAATKAGTISATKTGVIAATTSGTSPQATGTIPATRTNIATRPNGGSFSSMQLGFFELLLTIVHLW